jgi:hypothetical protein
MSPIDGLTERIRLPRIDKIRLGTRVPNATGNGDHPKAASYFVCPPAVQAVFGAEPRELRIMIPVEDSEQWCNQYYRSYSQTQGQVCYGDGKTGHRKVDTATGAVANHTSKVVEWRETACAGRNCPDYQAKKCSERMALQFMLPEVPGLGVWEINTGSINSIRNLNDTAAFIRSIYGRVRMVPLVLALVQIEVNNPDDGKRKKVWVLKLGAIDSLFDVARKMADVARRLPAGMELALPAPGDETPDDLITGEVDEPPTSESDELWGKTGADRDAMRAKETPATEEKPMDKPQDKPIDNKPEKTLDTKPAPQPAPVTKETVTAKQADKKVNPYVDQNYKPIKLTTFPELWQSALKRFGLSKTEAMKVLGVTDTVQIGDLGEAWTNLKAKMEAGR